MRKCFALVFCGALLLALCAGCSGVGPTGARQVRKPAPIFPIQVRPVEKVQPAGGSDAITTAGGPGSALSPVSPASPLPTELKPAGGSQPQPLGGSSGTVSPVRATPKEKPRATTSRDKVSATGYHDKDQDEPTQELPNPLDTRTVPRIEQLQAPAVDTQPAQTR